MSRQSNILKLSNYSSTNTSNQSSSVVSGQVSRRGGAEGNDEALGREVLVERVVRLELLLAETRLSAEGWRLLA